MPKYDTIVILCLDIFLGSPNLVVTIQIRCNIVLNFNIFDFPNFMTFSDFYVYINYLLSNQSTYI